MKINFNSQFNNSSQIYFLRRQKVLSAVFFSLVFVCIDKVNSNITNSNKLSTFIQNFNQTIILSIHYVSIRQRSSLAEFLFFFLGGGGGTADPQSAPPLSVSTGLVQYPGCHFHFKLLETSLLIFNGNNFVQENNE